MDGLLLDSEPLWSQAEVELAAGYGAVWTDEVKRRVVGTRLDVAVPIMLSAFGVEVDDGTVLEAAGRLLARMTELYAGPLRWLPGARDLVEACAQEGVPTALVSSSFRVLVDAALAAGLGPFTTTVAGDEVPRGKPSPDPWLAAAATLGVEPADCVVLEDSPAGVASGLAAGCAVVGVPSVPGVVLPPAERLRVVPSLRGVALGDLRALAARSAADG